MTAANPWYFVENTDAIDSPALLVYPERVKQNIAQAMAIAGGAHRLQPHAKTHKSEAVTRLQLEAGITAFKCATIAEAEMLGNCGAPEVLLAYQPVGPKVDRFLSLSHSFPGTRFSCLADNEGAATKLSQAAISVGQVISLYIDLNVGMNRTGISPAEAAGLYDHCCTLKGAQVIGLHAYDGHINDTAPAKRQQNADAAYAGVSVAMQAMADAGFTNPRIVVGGSPTFALHAAREGVVCSPGTVVYWDAAYSEAFPDLPFVPAAVVLSRVVSVLSPTTLCLDLGHKAIAAENPLHRRVLFLNAPRLQCIGQSEEHLVVALPPHHGFGVGDVLYGLPFHICPTCALYESAVVIEDYHATGAWAVTARDRRLTL